MHNHHINRLSIHREAVPTYTDHVKNPFDKLLLHLNQLYYQPNRHHLATRANKVHHHRTLLTASQYMFPHHHLDHLVIHRKLKALQMLIVVAATFQYHMHQVVVVHRPDTCLKIQHHLLEVDTEQDSVVDTEQDSVVDDILLQEVQTMAILEDASDQISLDHKPAAI